MKLRFLTIVAVVLIAFYAGVLVDVSRTTGDAISIPKTFEIVPTNAPESGRATEATFFFAESRPDPVLEAAAIAAIVAALFLLARLAVIVARRVRATR